MGPHSMSEIVNYYGKLINGDGGYTNLLIKGMKSCFIFVKKLLTKTVHPQHFNITLLASPILLYRIFIVAWHTMN